MRNKKFFGCWPAMITPFLDNNTVDYKAVKDVTEWYIAKGCDGIFAVCQSSEMFFLSEQEKIDIARAVVDAAAGRVPVVASGHTADDPSKQVDELGRMAQTGVDALILVSNRLVKQDEDENVMRKNLDNILRQLPGVPFGLYECPYPYLRLLSVEFLKDCVARGNIVFLKDVSCSLATQRKRAAVAKKTPLALLNANTATLMDSLLLGYDGYNGVMGNFHIDLYKWLYTTYRKNAGFARAIGDYLTLAALTELRAYPVSAKYHFNATSVPMGIHTRSKDTSVLNEAARLEIDGLIRMEKGLRIQLGLEPLPER